MPGLRVIPARDRFHHESDWLSTYWLFSFDHYHDPRNVSFGPLRVFNDDTVQPGKGFPPHSHADMEIVSYVISGALEHQDSRGNRGVIRAGEVQVMSAGSGITHAEYNPSPSEPVHFLQIWILPRHRGLEPRWDQRSFPAPERAGRLLPVVSGDARAPLPIDGDATIFVAALRDGDTVHHETAAGRRTFWYVVDGDVVLDGTALGTGDQARGEGVPALELKASRAAEVVLIDLG
jgi:redox-sensitive bicupin YhaK (pirin superfamily)